MQFFLYLLIFLHLPVNFQDLPGVYCYADSLQVQTNGILVKKNLSHNVGACNSRILESMYVTYM